MPQDNKYVMTLSLNILNHLGINLYSNVPAVLAEVVANAWDADAENIWIQLDKSEIVLTDDGHGMTDDDINTKYLCVGYRRRSTPGEAITPHFQRPVMGRKGIGKLSLFSVADIIEVQTVKDGQKNGFRLSTEDIQEAMTAGSSEQYYPLPLDPEAIEIEQGTKIVLSGLRKDIAQTASPLRKRLARRFSVIGSEHHFGININGVPVAVSDRDYFHKIQYLWLYDGSSEHYASLCPNLQNSEQRDGKLKDTHFEVSGWIGTVREPSDLKDHGDNLNKIVIMVRGKLAQEDILEEFGESGLYTKYVIGEIHADFLDIDDDDDITTSSRQKVIEDDPRYKALKGFVQKELKHIETAWGALRNKGGVESALKIPQIGEWFENLPPDHKKHAEAMFGKINQLPLEAEDKRRQFKYGVLAFESLRYKHNLKALDHISHENLQALTEVFASLDDIEATLYYQIISERIEIIKRLQAKVEENVLEKLVQEHLFKHLWLLDPAWERATDSAYMEKQVTAEFEKIDTDLTDEEKSGRLDIKYKKSSGMNVVIELKRADRVISTYDLAKQIDKYRTALIKLLERNKQGHEPVEFICIVGRELKEWADPKGRATSAKTLQAQGARVVMYQELISNAYKAYQEFLTKSAEAGYVYKLIQSIDTQDMD